MSNHFKEIHIWIITALLELKKIATLLKINNQSVITKFCMCCHKDRTSNTEKVQEHHLKVNSLISLRYIYIAWSLDNSTVLMGEFNIKTCCNMVLEHTFPNSSVVSCLSILRLSVQTLPLPYLTWS